MFDSLIRIPSPASLYEAHQAVWKAFHGTSKSKNGRDFLFRVRGRVGQENVIVKVRGATPIPGAQAIQVETPKMGHEYRFSMLSHPVRRTDGKFERSITDEAEIEAWAQELFARNGLAILSLVADESSRSPLGKRGHKVKPHVVSLTGTLAVQDETLAAAAYLHGIGRMKSMGFGMLELWRE